ncbi:MAG TPA: ABC transporter substrate-binding protein [Cyanobacteria bacterium UBA8803]|nr:ABC transporter substrate-binding protein [Cyanobacteria bacterium UBA9273]HBL61118.1 ABC transporter substrate-binding protein [Cyanobacteria bacterium UBA8803]
MMKTLKKKATQQVAFSEVLGIATEALWSNKLRTGLTMLGVVIGIASVTSITSIGQGIQKNVRQQIQSLGTDVLQVMSGAARSGNVFQGAGSSSTLTWEDAQALAKGAPSAKIVSATLQRSAQVVYGETNTNTMVYGADLNYPEARNTHPQSGRYFTQEEFNQAAQVAVLGPTVQRKLFGNATGLNEKIRVQGQIYRVIGVMESKGSQGPMDRDDTIFIPLTTVSARLVGNNAIRGISVNTIWIKGENQESLTAAQYQVTNILRLRHNIYNPDNDDFRIMNQSDLISTFSNVIGALTILVVAIASISLIVGGIGIANIMLVSVVERTREIGIRKALGANNSAILTQFMIEAVSISTVGGIIGAGTGVLIAFVSSLAFSFPFVVSGWSIIVGFVLSTVVGLVAGVIPARNAARLDPIAALRSE